MAFSPNGQLLAITSFDDAAGSSVEVCNAPTGQKLFALPLSKTFAFSVAFSPDGRLLAVGGSYGVVKVWDVRTRRELFTFAAHSTMASQVVFSPDGQRLFSVGVSVLHPVFGASTIGFGALPHGIGPFSASTELMRGGLISSYGSIPKGAIGHYEVKAWEMPTGLPVLGFEMHTFSFEGGYFQPMLAVSSDGKRLATLAGWRIGKDTRLTIELKVWDAASGVELFSRKALEDSPEAFNGHPVFSPDGLFLAGGCKEGIRLLDANTYAEVRALRGAGGRPLAFSPDGKRLATGNNGRSGGNVKLWDVKAGRELLTLRVPPDSINTYCLAFSPDGYYLAAGDHLYVRIWDGRPLEKGE
jgi:WD40 repeat protein